MYNKIKNTAACRRYREKNKEKHEKYVREYRERTKERRRKYQQSDAHKKSRKKCYLKNKQRYLKNGSEYMKKNPWIHRYSNAKNRCINPKYKSYPRYGGKGIKFLITMDELKYIWSRDKASLMRKPSLDRINNDGDYAIENCRFIELSENCTKGNHEKMRRINKDISPFISYYSDFILIKEFARLKIVTNI